MTLTNFFEKGFLISKGKSFLIETDGCKEFVNKTFNDLLNKNKFERYGRYTSLGDFFAKKFNRTIRDLLEKPVFQPRDGNWVDILPTKTKQ